ncbi:MAG TPA: hypothetical protein VMB71_03050 [Acetobacteraceae bacterium]|nr:hypothetical protein [Acetobacteraceae bacterium]
MDAVRRSQADAPAEAQVDAEVYSVIVLTSAIIGPRIFRNSVRPDEDTETVVRRFRGERLRMLKYGGLLRP